MKKNDAKSVAKCISFLCVFMLGSYVQARCESADSIISRMHLTAGKYADYVVEYNAGLYIKSQMDIIDKNIGFRYIPGLFRSEDDANRYLVETYSELHYTAPNIYDQKVKTLSGTINDSRSIPGMLDYFNVNIYAPYLLGEKLLSPLAPNSWRYYVYRIDSVSVDSLGRAEFHIRYKPRNKSFQLVEGSIVVTDGVWSVRRFTFKGRFELMEFQCAVEMGKVGRPDEFLPVYYDVVVLYSFIYNTVEGYYEAKLKYHDIQTKEDRLSDETRKRGYNLSASFSLSCDQTDYLHDEARFDSLRPIPLTDAEKLIYRKYHRSRSKQKDRVLADSLRALSNDDKWSAVGGFFFEDNKWKLSDNITLRTSPFINPLLISYSKTTGVSYRQNLKVNTVFGGQRSLYAGARIGYNFTNREFYWMLETDYNYSPEHLGTLHVSLGNGNRIYNSRIMEELQQLPTDSVLDIQSLNLEEFTDFNVEVSNRIELVNGLSLQVGLIYHQRTPIEKPDIPFNNMNLPEHVAEGLNSSVRSSYRTFAPRIKLEWTPCMYYYMNGRQKVNLRSKYPTFIFDYERGLKNVFNSSGVYERIELDMQHHVKLGLLYNLYYRIGAGFFTNTEETYFVDFVNFRKSNLPHGWNDEIGGVFQALGGRWYNVSPYYVRGHITYEAPFLLFRHLIKYTSHVQNERIYLNLLTMKHLGPYFELGYGIGTFVFDVGAFLSLEHFSKVGFGCKFTFELFN